MFNLFHGTLPIHLQNRFTRYSTTRSTRRINKFVMVQARTNINAMCLSVYGVKLWNSLSTNLKGHCIEFKYYADGIHSGLTPPGNNS